MLANMRINSTALDNSNRGIDVILIGAICDLEHSSLEVRVLLSSSACMYRQAPSEASQNLFSKKYSIKFFT